MKPARENRRLRIRAEFPDGPMDKVSDEVTELERENRQLRVVIEAFKGRNKEIGKLGGRPPTQGKKKPTFGQILAVLRQRVFNNPVKGWRSWLVQELADRYKVDVTEARRWVREVFGPARRKKKKRE